MRTSSGAPRSLQLALGFAVSLVAGCMIVAGLEDRTLGVDAASDAADEDTAKDGATPDDGPASACDTTKPFGVPTLMGELNLDDAGALQARLSPDGLTVFFNSMPVDGGGIYTATRTSTGQPFGNATPLAITPPSGASPTPTSDLLTLYFMSPAGASPDIYVATRGSPTGLFSPGSMVPAITTSTLAENGPYVLPDHTALYFAAARQADGGTDPGGGPITVRAFRSTISPGGTVSPPSELDLGGVTFAPVVTPDELTIYFSSNRAGSVGVSDIWMARRASKGVPFNPPVNVTELNVASANQQPNFITADGCTLYFHSTRLKATLASIFRAERGR